MPARRILTVIISVVLLQACGGGDSSTPSEPEPSPTASSVSVSPSSANSNAFDDTIDFSATVRDQNGNTMSEVSVSWSSTNQGVASILSEGQAISQGSGTADIVASAEGHSDSVTITVDQKAKQVEVAPVGDTVTAGDSAQLSANATDANGNAIVSPNFQWTSSDTSVAIVDSTGSVYGKQEGAVSIAAQLDGESDSSDLVIEPTSNPDSPPTLDSATPLPIPEDGAATLSGSNFASLADSNTVVVDGDTATISSATATSLDINIPLYDCLPARGVSIKVVTPAGADSIRVQMSPNENPVQVSAGQQLRIENPSKFCLQFEASGTATSYLLGIQSASEVASALTPVSAFAVMGQAPTSQSTSTYTIQDTRQLSQEGTAPEPDPRLQRHSEAELDLMRTAREQFGAKATSSLAYQQSDGIETLRSAVSGSVSVGDSVQVDIGQEGDLCQVKTTITAKVRHVGTHGIWLTDVNNPSGGYTDSEIQQYSDQFDNLLYPTDTLHFGSPTDIDNNGKAVLVITKEVNKKDGLLGYVSPADMYPPSGCPASNEGELTYLLTPDPNGVHGTAWSASYLLEHQPRTIGHEFVHMIQVSRRFAAGHGFLDIWLAEGQAVLGEEVIGHAATGRTSSGNYGSSTATYGMSSGGSTPWYWNAFRDLGNYYGYETNTSKVPGAPEECGWLARDWAGGGCTGSRSVYGAPWTLLRWATDHYGPTYNGGKTGFQRDLIGNPENGYTALETLTGSTMEKILSQWAASLYVDDRLSSPDQMLSHPSWDLYNIFQNQVESARLIPADAPFADFEASGSIRAGSSGYIRISDSDRPATAIRIRTQSDTELTSEMQIWLVRLQ